MTTKSLTSGLLMTDDINSPEHYNAGSPLETINILKHWLNEHPFYTPFQGYVLGNVIKYISRAGKKTTDPTRDLKKARWYLSRLIEEIEKESV